MWQRRERYVQSNFRFKYKPQADKTRIIRVDAQSRKSRRSHFYTISYVSKSRKFWFASSLGCTIFVPFLIRKIRKIFCLRLNYLFKFLSGIRHISQFLVIFRSRPKKYLPDRIGAGIDPLTRIATSYICPHKVARGLSWVDFVSSTRSNREFFQCFDLRE